MRESEQLRTIIDGCIREDLSAQHQLYKDFYPYAISVCLRYESQEHEAISILNDAFMKVFGAIKKYDQNKPFNPWFRTIIVNTAIDHIKKYKKFKNENHMDNAKEMSVSESIISKLGHDEIMKAVESLSTMYRTVFNMHVIDGYRHDEISTLLGISVNTSKSNLSRAKSNLRILLHQKLSIKNA